MNIGFNNKGDKRMSEERIIKTIRDYQAKIKLLSGICRLMAIVSCLGLPLGMLLFYLFAKYSSASRVTVNIPMIIAAIVIWFFCFWFLSRIYNKLQINLKEFAGEHVLKEIIAERIKIFEYSPNGNPGKKFLRSLGVLPSFDNVYGSDYIRGMYKENEIMYCDLKLEEEYETTDSDGDRVNKSVTVFQGQVISLVLGKPLGDKRLRISERANKRKPSGFMQNAFENVASALGIKINEHVVSLENEAFNNQFEVKSNDEEFAFYILTPHFMESIVRADVLANGRTNICFSGNRASISMYNGRDAFELGKKLCNKKRLEEDRQKMRNDLSTILSIVDEILNKERLFNSEE